MLKPNDVVEVYTTIDLVTKKLKKQHSKEITCFNCKESHCCKKKSRVNIYQFEKEFFKTFITDNIIEKTNKENDNNYTCPFLTDDGKCSIYENRPLECRAYYVMVNTPDDCSIPDKIIDIVNISQIAVTVNPNIVKILIKDPEGIDLLKLVKEKGDNNENH